MKLFKISSILLAGSLLGSLVSCNKGIGTDEVSEGRANVYFELNRGISAESMTKAATEPGDDNLGNVQVLLFDHSSGVLAYSAKKTLNAITGTVEVSDVPMNIAFDYRVVANVSQDFASASSVTDIDNYIVALKDFAANSVPMFASGTKTFSSESSAGKSVSANLQRAASRIEVQKIQADFTGSNSWIAGQAASVTGMYIYKAPGVFRLGLTDVPAASKVYWHNGSYKAADVTALGAIAPYVGEAISTGNVITNNGSYEASHWFLCCPEGAYTASPAENGTFFTIEVTIGGVPYYYGVPLSAMGLKANYKYVISNIKLTKLGNINPPGIIDEQQASFAINVEPWQTDPNFNGSIEF